jgi:galactokinase
MGEYYQFGKGLVLAVGIDRFVRVAVSARKDNALRFFTAPTSERKRTTILNLKYKKEDRWANHIKLAISIFAERGFDIKGMNFTIDGRIPWNIGLASAAAIEVASALALRTFFKCSINDKDLINSLAASHKEFYEGEDWLPDFLLMMSAKKDHFVLSDESSLEVEKIKSPVPKYKILIMDSKVPFFGAEDELRIRREDLAAGLEALSKKKKAKSFKDFVGMHPLELMNGLEEEVRRRSLHAVQEFARLKEIEAALKEGDLPTLTRNIYHSHESLRDLYEVSCPEVDWLVNRAKEMDGVVGARMTGNGFGGCVYVIIHPDKVKEYLTKMDDYERIFGFHPVVHEVQIAGCAKVIAK